MIESMSMSRRAQVRGASWGRSRKRKWATVLAVVVATAGLSALQTQTASAAVFRCLAFNQFICATVTAISPGSALLVHNKPSYTGGVVPGSPRMVNGDWVVLGCWTTGSGDADGHGDRYWFYGGSTNKSGPDGYINDWYLTTGAFSQWSRYVPHC